MRLFPRTSTALLALLAASAPGATPSASPADPVTLKTVPYDDLARTVRGLQGQVVVVDFWQTT